MRKQTINIFLKASKAANWTDCVILYIFDRQQISVTT